MRTFDTRFQTAIRSGSFDPFLAIGIATTPAINLVTLTDAITISGTTYRTAALENTDLPKLEALPKRDSLRLYLDDSGDFDHLLGKTHAIAFVSVGIQSDPTFLEPFFPGRLLGASRVVDYDNQTRNIIVDIDIVATGLEATVKRNNTREYQRRINANDTCFDGVYADTPRRVDNYWGRRA